MNRRQKEQKRKDKRAERGRAGQRGRVLSPHEVAMRREVRRAVAANPNPLCDECGGPAQIAIVGLISKKVNGYACTPHEMAVRNKIAEKEKVTAVPDEEGML